MFTKTGESYHQRVNSSVLSTGKKKVGNAMGGFSMKGSKTQRDLHGYDTKQDHSIKDSFDFDVKEPISSEVISAYAGMNNRLVCKCTIRFR